MKYQFNNLTSPIKRLPLVNNHLWCKGRYTLDNAPVKSILRNNFNMNCVPIECLRVGQTFYSYQSKDSNKLQFMRLETIHIFSDKVLYNCVYLSQEEKMIWSKTSSGALFTELRAGTLVFVPVPREHFKVLQPCRVVAKKTMSMERIRKDREKYNPTLWPETNEPTKENQGMLSFTMKGKNMTIRQFFFNVLKAKKSFENHRPIKLCRYLICAIENAYYLEDLGIKGICKFVNKDGKKTFYRSFKTDMIDAAEKKLEKCKLDRLTLKHIHDQCVEYRKYELTKQKKSYEKKSKKMI